MSKKIAQPILLLLLLAVVQSKLNAQDFYWSDNRRIPLFEDTKNVLIKIEENSNLELKIRSSENYSLIEKT